MDTFTVKCVNLNSKCKQWAAAGGCQKNPNYMVYNCRLACGLCGNAATKSSVTSPKSVASKRSVRTPRSIASKRSVTTPKSTAAKSKLTFPRPQKKTIKSNTQINATPCFYNGVCFGR
ncbi:hypothetical protein RRG08_035222 [Elysia crispata]|uniref:ShKT domain-containing protein n=1 Tax=Elysia crispata TaxID=231223 RepID=A0AAE0ZNQ9_9GAST|nr:hypothetical protein RRG08_035222 [Elysia crispata]